MCRKIGSIGYGKWSGVSDTWFKEHSRHIWTWRKPGEAKTQIDYITEWDSRM